MYNLRSHRHVRLKVMFLINLRRLRQVVTDLVRDAIKPYAQ